MREYWGPAGLKSVGQKCEAPPTARRALWRAVPYRARYYCSRTADIHKTRMATLWPGCPATEPGPSESSRLTYVSGRAVSSAILWLQV